MARVADATPDNFKSKIKEMEAKLPV